MSCKSIVLYSVDIPVIPELETETEIDSTYQIAMAPKYF